MNNLDKYYDDDLMGPADLLRNGEIITFYSFKGGVGRTMALANTAFLAASNGLRVLVVDWDLEAPGLAYYFRGVQEPSFARELRAAPGVLNFLWEWGNNIQSDSKTAVDDVTALFDSGAPFQLCTRQLVQPAFFEQLGGSIDYIGAGSPRIRVPAETAYEDALARFPWHDFFTRMAGGYVSQALRAWAKKKYDLILIDSRTGLAESAGICTMQIPDSVALCFVLNRQNIEGISKIASVIRANKPDVKLMAAPMRVSREGTAEENEARAKAITDLTRLGGFTAETAQQQLISLAIKHADNVPFYESLAPIVAEDPEVDVMTVNYLRFAREVTGRSDLTLVPFDEELLSRARARLQPQLATSEYVEKLVGSEPLRAVTELQSLISSAEELVASGERGALSDDYLRLLTSVAFEPRMLQFADRAFGLQRQALNILRMLAEATADWGPVLIYSLEAHLTTSAGMFDDVDEIAVREELDNLLGQSKSPAAELKRLENRRRIAWLYYKSDNDVASQTAADVMSMVRKLRKSNILGEEGADDLIFIESDIMHLKGRLYFEDNDFSHALESFKKALDLCTGVAWDLAKPDLKRSIAEVNAFIALRRDLKVKLEDRINYAVQAARISGTGLATFQFVNLLDVLSEDHKFADSLMQFLELTLGPITHQTRIPPMAIYWGRSIATAHRFLQATTQAVLALKDVPSQQRDSVLNRLAVVVDATIVQLARRRVVSRGKHKQDIGMEYEKFRAALKQTAFFWPEASEAQDALRSLAASGRIPPVEFQ